MRALGAGLLAIALVLPACGSSPKPAAQPTESQTPSPTPTLPPVAEDKATATRSLLTVADLGKPWIQPKAVNEVKKKTKGELCPGKPGARVIHKARAEVNRAFTEGAKTGAAIGSYGVRVYDFGEAQDWRDAVAKAEKSCTAWKSLEKLYVTLEVIDTPPAVAGADEVHAHIERVYADAGHKTLYYVRHYYEALIGDRVVVSFEYAFIQPKTDPTGKDMAKSARLLAKQVAKTRAAFAL